MALQDVGVEFIGAGLTDAGDHREYVSITTTMRYAHVAPSALRTAIELANPRTAGAPNFGQPVSNRWRGRHLQNRSLQTEVAENQASAP
jgi:hypothetical protein